MYAHYDRQADIAWFAFDGKLAANSIHSSDEEAWGLIDRDGNGAVIAVEIWGASERLPRPLLDGLPEPETEAVTIEVEPTPASG